ncbi:MAG: LemA family protein [Bacteroidetes bacterium]|nr:LemA family protein [Bacteroidota bacterium]
MKKSWIVIAIFVVLIVYLIARAIGFYNVMVTQGESVDKQWSDVESSYQRRADLIPNLVATVKGYASHERETLEGVINARAKATQTTINAGELTPESMANFQQAQDGLSSALSRLMVVVERYPDLKANQNFLELQSQLEGAENRINVARMKFNEAARQYNTYIKLFPKNMLANLFGFDAKPYFEAQQGAETAPKVEF